jgi:hypothetical protein
MLVKMHRSEHGVWKVIWFVVAISFSLMVVAILYRLAVPIPDSPPSNGPEMSRPKPHIEKLGTP